MIIVAKRVIKLLYFIIQHTPKEKRLVYATNMSKEPDVWKSDDELQDYREGIRKSFMETLVDGISEGADYGEQIGEALFGGPGRILGKAIGGVAGGLGQIAKGGVEFLKSGVDFLRDHMLPF